MDKPGPLTIKRPEPASAPEQTFVILLILGPLIGLWYTWRHHLNIHLDQPWWNLALHAGLLVIPLVWVVLISHRPFQFGDTGEELLCTSTFWDKLPTDWWSMLMLWTPLFFAALSLGHDLLTDYLPNATTLSTTPLKAVAIMGVTFLLGLFYAASFSGNPERYTWVCDAGLRASLMRFYEWRDIHHVIRQGSVYSVCHRSNPAFPAVAFKLRDNPSQAKFETYLAQHQVPVTNTTDPIFTLAKAGVVVASLLIMLLAIWLRVTTELSLLWITSIAFGIAIVLTLAFEQFRGISRQKKHWPRNEALTDLDFGPRP